MTMVDELQSDTHNALAKIRCGGCEQWFASQSCFDQHRIGEIKAGTRRCMTNEQMIAAGMATETRKVNVRHSNVKMQEVHEVWYHVEDREKMRLRFR